MPDRVEQHGAASTRGSSSDFGGRLGQQRAPVLRPGGEVLGQHRRCAEQRDQPAAEPRVHAQRLEQLVAVVGGLEQPGQPVHREFRSAGPGDRDQDVLAAGQSARTVRTARRRRGRRGPGRCRAARTGPACWPPAWSSVDPVIGTGATTGSRVRAGGRLVCAAKATNRCANSRHTSAIASSASSSIGPSRPVSGTSLARAPSPGRPRPTSRCGTAGPTPPAPCRHAWFG